MTAIGHAGRQGLNREFQKKLLLRLANYYPHSHVGRWEELHEDETTVKVNLHYLREHGLIETDAIVEKNFGGGFAYGYSRINHKGLDFLEADGGLGAILGVQVVKLHEDDIRVLLTNKVLQSDLPELEKNRLIESIKELPSEGIQHLAMKLLDAGWEKAPQAWSWISTLIDSLKTMS